MIKSHALIITRHIGFVLSCLGLWLRASAAPDYTGEIKPLLARRCVSCHGATQAKGGLRLDTAAALRKGGDHGDPLRPDKPDASLLLQVAAGTHESIPRMPYKRNPLDSAEVDLIRGWIASGAAAPAAEQPSSDQHWAFIRPVRPAPPVGRNAAQGSRSPIDIWIQERLQREGIAPAPEADRSTLIRRLSLDLVGMPPSQAEVDEFLSDWRPDAYERLVDRLMASPHYGERQARAWLDAARYADSNGYSIDSARSIWPYRDWVVRALNADMPFDQFTVWQIAGDLLPIAGDSTDERRLDPLIASGFNRNTQVNHEGGIDTEQFRIESIVDRVNTTAAVWLGLTMGCAQCHDHKYDPLSTRDYYRMFAFFNQDENDGHGSPALVADNTLDIGTPAEIRLRTEQRAAIRQAETNALDWAERELRPRLPAWESSLDSKLRDSFTPLLKEVLQIPAGARNKDQANLVWNKFRELDPEWQRRQADIGRMRQALPPLPSTLVMKRRSEPRTTVAFIKGDFTRRGDIVSAGTPASLHPYQPATNPAGESASPASRLDLARWLVDPRNPLTARVTVNRLWQQFFGRGLVETENDFGSQGTPPSHPELLDWLACEFLADDGGTTPATRTAARDGIRPWSLKHIIRVIVTSHTYRQSSHATPVTDEKDPRNILLSRQNRIRIDAEAVRDVSLAISGLLSSRIGGPPVYPPQPSGMEAFTQNAREWPTSQGENRFRRGLYTWRQRTIMYPSLTVFDAPDASTACTRRNRSNTPLQSLTLLNDEAFHELATAFARRLAETSDSPPARLEFAFRTALARPPSLSERERLLSLVEQELASGASGKTAWLAVARVLLNLDETITRE